MDRRSTPKFKIDATRLMSLALLGIALLIGLFAVRAATASGLAVLHNFNGTLNNPRGNLVQAADGNFYGTTASGGSGPGSVIRVTPSGQLTTLHAFSGPDGVLPIGGLVEGLDGNFYGTTAGSTGYGYYPNGTVFKISPRGAFTNLYSFTGGTDGGSPYGTLVLGPDGNFYGTTAHGGSNGFGVIFKITPTGTLTVVHNFLVNDGGASESGLTLGSDGNFYGITYYYGANNGGTIYRLTQSGTFSVLYALNPSTDGMESTAPLVQASDGNFYGTTLQGGSGGTGTIFRVTPAGNFTVLYAFAQNAGQPTGPLVQGPDGSLYGTSFAGGSANLGQIFSVSPSGVFSSIYSFTGNNDGAEPTTGLVIGSNGLFYGGNEGLSGAGTIYSYSPGGTVNAVVGPSNTDGRGAMAQLMLANDGNYYGTSGGAFGRGGIFQLTPAAQLNMFYSFPGGNLSGSPNALIQGVDGNLYGTSYYGGRLNAGSFFSLSTSDVFTSLYAFSGSSDGGYPLGSLVQGADGNFYGTTSTDNISGYGEVFKVTPTGSLTVLHTFTNGSDGSQPRAGLAVGRDGNFYGTTTSGGAYNSGAAFMITPGGAFTILHSFLGSEAQTALGLTLGSDGNFYGAATYGGAHQAGSIYMMTPTGALTVLHSFAGGPEGQNPECTLIQAKDGNFYGTTTAGGAGYGTLFEITPTGTLTTLYTFTGGADGGYPYAGVIQGADGNFYGISYSGGIANLGTIYEFAVAPPAAPTLTSASPGNGQVTLQWTANNGPATYNLYRGTTPGGEGTKPVATGITNAYATDVSLTDGTTYYYKVTAVNAAGEGAQSNELSATPVQQGPPSTSVSLSGQAGNSPWYLGQVTVTLTATPGSYPVAATYYTLDGGPQQSYTAPFTVSGDGTHTVTCWSVDTNGTSETAHSQPVDIDTTPPVSTSSVANYTVTLTATDTLSGVGNTYYTVDGGAQQTYSSPFTVSNNANHTVTYWAVDVAGNIESAHTISIVLPLKTTASLSGWTGNNGWYRGPVTVTLTATDGGGTVTGTYYTVDGGAQQAYTGAFTVSGDAVHTITYWSTDAAGNTETAHSQSIKIDGTTPVSTLTSIGSGSFAITATDNLSGVWEIWYNINNGPWQVSPGFGEVDFSVLPGTYDTIQYFSIDNAGNEESTRTLVVDQVPPVTTASLSGTTGTNGWYTSAVTVTLTATDQHSTVNATYYTVDGGAQQTYSGAFAVSTDGSHTITYWSTDAAGNTETANSQSFKIDATVPVVTFGAVSPAANGAGWNNSSVSISFTTSDATSGVASVSTSSPLTFTAEGANQTKAVTVTDNAGNSQTYTTAAVNIDLTAPSTTANVSGAQVTLTASDNLSGVASTYYMIDGGAQQTYTSPFNVTAGTHTVAYWSVDKAGNTETSHTTSVVTNPAPSITSISPSSAYAGGPAFTLTVTGSSFISGSTVTWNGASLATTYVSSTQLTASVPASDISATGTATVAVVTPAPGGGTSSGLAFTVNPNPAPSISSISPSTVTAGTGAFTLTVNGSGFVSTSVVKANGTTLTTTYVSSTQVTAAVPASTIASAGSVSITVTNPAPGGGTSGTATLTVVPATIASVALNPTSVKGGSSSAGTVTLTGPAPSGGFVVSLSSSSSKASLSTKSLTIPAGSTSGAFTVSTSKVNSTTTVTITAKNGTTSKTATLTITP
jgi:uncharacterized repeat protein (TIGR03803 family)